MNLDTLLQATASVEDVSPEALKRARPSFDGLIFANPAVIGIDRARRRRRALALTAVAAATAAGLVISPVLGHTPTSVAHADEVVTAAGLGDPLGRVQDAWRLQTAQGMLIARCMAARGLVYYPTPIAYPRQPADTSDLQPTQTGYGIQSHIASHETEPTSRQDAYEKSLTPAQKKDYEDAFFGTDASRVAVDVPGGSGTLTTSGSGCLAIAETTLYGSVQAAAIHGALPQIVSGEISVTASRDLAYRATLATWVTCMRGAGFDDASPDDAVGRLAGEYTSGDPAAVHVEEVREAKADLNCNGTGLRAVLRDAQLRAATRVPEDQTNEVLANEKVRARAVARARKTLG